MSNSNDFVNECYECLWTDDSAKIGNSDELFPEFQYKTTYQDSAFKEIDHPNNCHKGDECSITYQKLETTTQQLNHSNCIQSNTSSLNKLTETSSSEPSVPLPTWNFDDSFTNLNNDSNQNNVHNSKKRKLSISKHQDDEIHNDDDNSNKMSPNPASPIRKKRKLNNGRPLSNVDSYNNNNNNNNDSTSILNSQLTQESDLHTDNDNNNNNDINSIRNVQSTQESDLKQNNNNNNNEYISNPNEVRNEISSICTTKMIMLDDKKEVMTDPVANCHMRVLSSLINANGERAGSLLLIKFYDERERLQFSAVDIGIVQNYFKKKDKIISMISESINVRAGCRPYLRVDDKSASNRLLGPSKSSYHYVRQKDIVHTHRYENNRFLYSLIYILFNQTHENGRKKLIRSWININTKLLIQFVMYLISLILNKKCPFDTKLLTSIIANVKNSKTKTQSKLQESNNTIIDECNRLQSQSIHYTIRKSDSIWICPKCKGKSIIACIGHSDWKQCFDCKCIIKLIN